MEKNTGKQKIVHPMDMLPTDEVTVTEIKSRTRSKAQELICKQIADGRSYFVRLGEAEFLKGGEALRGGRLSAGNQQKTMPQVIVHFEVTLMLPDEAGIGDFVSESAIPPQALQAARASEKFMVDDEITLELNERGWRRSA